jgi:hypothetical protein
MKQYVVVRPGEAVVGDQLSVQLPSRIPVTTQQRDERPDT